MSIVHFSHYFVGLSIAIGFSIIFRGWFSIVFVPAIAAGAATYCQGCLWRYSWVEGSLLTPNQLSLAGTVKGKLDLLKLIKLTKLIKININLKEGKQFEPG